MNTIILSNTKKQSCFNRARRKMGQAMKNELKSTKSVKEGCMPNLLMSRDGGRTGEEPFVKRFGQTFLVCFYDHFLRLRLMPIQEKTENHFINESKIVTKSTKNGGKDEDDGEEKAMKNEAKSIKSVKKGSMQCRSIRGESRRRGEVPLAKRFAQAFPKLDTWWLECTTGWDKKNLEVILEKNV